MTKPIPLEIAMRGASASDAAIQRLSSALQLRTVTQELSSEDTRPAFEEFRAKLPVWFPNAHDVLETETIGERGALHYVWRGRDPDLEPWLFISHQDVVDAQETSSHGWTHPPFSGAVADGFVWGRGAIDLKVSIMAVMEAIERLASEGFTPMRSAHLAFGADEEVGGASGAGAISAAFRDRGDTFTFSLDEGGVVASDVLPGVDTPVAVIGLAEKGYLSLRLTCAGDGGHSSMPDPDAPVELLLRLLGEIQRASPKPRLAGPTLELLKAVSPVVRWPFSWLYGGASFLAPLLLRAFRANPAALATVQTSLAITGLSAGGVDNVIPDQASAILNYRLMPGDRSIDLIKSAETLARRYGASVEVLEQRDASKISSVRVPAYEALCSAIQSVMPDVACAPCLTLNGTDSKHYEDLVRDQYRFLPVRAAPEDLKRIHGVDERISIENYQEMIAVYAELFRRIDSFKANDP